MDIDIQSVMALAQAASLRQTLGSFDPLTFVAYYHPECPDVKDILQSIEAFQSAYRRAIESEFPATGAEIERLSYVRTMLLHEQIHFLQCVGSVFGLTILFSAVAQYNLVCSLIDALKTDHKLPLRIPLVTWLAREHDQATRHLIKDYLSLWADMELFTDTLMGRCVRPDDSWPTEKSLMIISNSFREHPFRPNLTFVPPKATPDCGWQNLSTIEILEAAARAADYLVAIGILSVRDFCRFLRATFSGVYAPAIRLTATHLHTHIPGIQYFWSLVNGEFEHSYVNSYGSITRDLQADVQSMLLILLTYVQVLTDISLAIPICVGLQQEQALELAWDDLHPGLRFERALIACQKIQPLVVRSFVKEERLEVYSNLVTKVCKKLKWSRPDHYLPEQATNSSVWLLSLFSQARKLRMYQRAGFAFPQVFLGELFRDLRPPITVYPPQERSGDIQMHVAEDIYSKRIIRQAKILFFCSSVSRALVSDKYLRIRSAVGNSDVPENSFQEFFGLSTGDVVTAH